GVARQRSGVAAQGRHAGFDLVQQVHRARARSLLFDRGVPDSADAVAGGVAGLGVLDPELERHALEGPHLAAVGAVDDGEVTLRLGAGIGHQRRPVLGALVVAVGHAGSVLVVGVESHAVGVGQHFLAADLGALDGTAGIVL